MSVDTERSKVQRSVLRELERWQPTNGLDPALFRDFARETIGRIRGPFLAQHPPRQVLRYLEAALRFALVRAPDEVHAEVRTGPGRRGVQVLSHMDDQPFIVDTIRLFLRRGQADYWGGFNVIFRCDRDAGGRLLGVGEQGAMVESLALIEADGGTLVDDLEAATGRLTHALVLAKLAVRDFRPMTRALERFVERCEALADRHPERAERYLETGAFLKWLLRDTFVFMGMQVGDQRFGIETVEGPFAGTPEGDWVEAHPPGTVQVRKCAQDSPIHRNGRIDELLVTLDPHQPTEERLFVRGLFTYRAVTQPSRNVPVLRGVLRAILEAQEAVPGSFRYKGIANVFDSLPTEFLFTTPRDAVAHMIELVLDSETQQEVGVTVLRNADGSAFALVSMPKTFYSDDLRREVEAEIHHTLRPTYVDHGLFVGRFETLLLHYYLTGIRGFRDAEVLELIERVRVLATPWTSRLWQSIAEVGDEQRADYLVDTYGRAFPDAYMRRTPTARALEDIRHLDSLTSGRVVAADLFVDAEDRVVLRIYQARDVFLTDLVPVLDNFGLRVRSSEVVEVQARGGSLQFDSFVLDVRGEERERLFRHKDVLVEALPAVFDGGVEDDPLNQLVISAGLRWREVDVVRAYSRYMRQLQVPISLPRLQTMLLQIPDLVGRLHELFRARFDPDLTGDASERERQVRSAEERVSELLRRIHTHDQDLVFGGLHNLIEATVRTNAFRDDRDGHYLSLKIDCARVRDMKGPRPLFEIYVHAREVEGVHLRFGKVARGGLRWSDRGDFRTEVLGLATTQQVKNVVIVPEGAKGGFYVRNPAKDAAGRRAQADLLYETFIRGLLDLTDNVVDGRVVPPPRVVRRDPDDPYLVVAADKGTAHLSDTANAVSRAYRFWLDDAFASGGSQGYDHKKVGITARGAWVLVKRHFAELGRDPFAEPFTCVGVGDMGGDVFGNGLLASRKTRLIAAFNHLHVFLDPDPDPEVSWQERSRLFQLGGRDGGWDRYDPALISEGGGIYDRGAKSIPLSARARELLGITEAEPEPEVVIRAILRLEVDLIWMGGIGTYVKAEEETHADVDDRSNDRFRVDATELRARIVGEGANLSVTQEARIEASLAGVRLNADFIDNSGGVDLSDHEVNLKILLRGPVGRGDLSPDARDALLRDMSDEVAALVLADNDTQGRQISRDRIRSQQDIFPFARAIAFVERRFGVDRRQLHLPDEEELLERARASQGLTRPELAVLSAWVKRYVSSELIASRRARTIDGFSGFLHGYFPAAVRERWPGDVDAHQLAEEIAMTVVTTRVVGDAGAAFVPLAVESTGREVFDVCDAYLRAQRLARAYEVRSALEDLRTTVSLQALYRAWVEVDAGCREVTMTWLSPGNRTPTDAEIDEMGVAVDQVYELQADDVVRRNQAKVEALRAADVPEHVARLVVKASYLDIALRVWWHAKKLGVSFGDVVVRQLAAGRASRLQEIVDVLRARPASGQWEPIAVQILAGRFVRLLRELVLRLPAHAEARTVDELEPILTEGSLRDVRRQVDNMLPQGAAPDLATLLVLEERLTGAVGRVPTPS